MRYLILGLLFVLPTTVSAEIVFTKPLVHLGVIKGGAQLQQRFEFEVKGSHPITIVGFERSCGCLHPQWEQTVYQPGKKGAFNLEIRSLGQQDGPHAWNATLVYREGEETKQAALTIQVEVRNEVVVQPPRLALFVESLLTQEIKVHDRREKPLEVLKVECSVPGIKFEMKKEGPAVTKIFLYAKAENLPVERKDGAIQIYTTDAEYPMLEVPIMVKRNARAVLQFNPEVVRLGIAANQESASAVVRLKHRDREPVKILKVEGSHPALRCTWASGPGTDATLRVSAACRDITPGAVQASVHVYLEGDEHLVLPVVFIPE